MCEEDCQEKGVLVEAFHFMRFNVINEYFNYFNLINMKDILFVFVSSVIVHIVCCVGSRSCVLSGSRPKWLILANQSLSLRHVIFATANGM